MKIKTLNIDYFMSFGPGNSINLEDRGLTLVNGINEISESAISNGAGKTNLQEAITWAIYGQLTKNVGVNDVVNNIHKKDCRVEIVLDSDEWDYHIERFRKHTAHDDDLLFYRTRKDPEENENLAGVDKAETQGRIERFIGCGFTLFCNSAYFSQVNVKPFSTYTDKQIKEVFIEAIDISRFSVALEKVKDDLKTFRKEAATLEGKQARLNEEIEEAGRRKIEYQAKHDNFADQKKEGLAQYDLDIKKLEEQISILKTKAGQYSIIKSSIESQQKQIEKLPEILDKQSKFKEGATKFTNSFNLLQQKVKDIQRFLDTKNAEKKAVSSRIGTNCSECGKPITDDDLKDVVAGIQTHLENKTSELTNLQTLIGKADPQADKLREQAQNIEDEIEAVRKIERDVATLQVSLARVDTAKRELFVLEGNLKSQKDKKNAKAAEESPWQSFIDKEQALIDDALEKIEALKKTLIGKNEEIQYSEYWENAFGYGGIPSFMLDAVTPFLNERANHHSTTITGGEIDIEFSTISATKKGEIRDKFAINVSHKNGAKAYKGSSGGERKRADLCIAQSIQDMARSYGKNTLAYCSYDEPFENLDEEGVANVMEMLTEIAKEIGTCLVVTHNSELKAMIDGTITIIKGKDGYSRIMA